MKSPLSPLSAVEKVRERYHPIHALRRVDLVRRLSRRCDIQLWARLHGVSHPMRLYLLRNGSYLLNRRSPEPRIAALVLAILDSCEIKSFWDVGAHIGYYSWLVSSARSSIRIVAAEPDVMNFDLMKQTHRHASHVELLNVAISAADGAATFLLDTVSGATGTLELSVGSFNERHYGEARHSTTVPTHSLDSLTVTRGMPDLLKIDVEGHEGAVLDGAVSVLRSDPLVLIEVFDSAAQALRTLRANGFHLFSASSLSDTTPDDGNYVALPNARLDVLDALRQAHVHWLAKTGVGASV